jgi:hypothetical protein
MLIAIIGYLAFRFLTGNGYVTKLNYKGVFSKFEVTTGIGK